MRRQKKLINNSEGQSTIEFIVTFAFSFSMLFIFVKIAMNYTNGYMVHYATYMASRVFLVYDTNEGTGDVYNKARIEAIKEFERHSIDKILGPNIYDINRLQIKFPSSVGNKLYVGAIFSFKDKFSFTKTAGGAVPMDFISESFLGRAPARSTCRERTCAAIESVTGVNRCNEFATVVDNGC